MITVLLVLTGGALVAVGMTLRWLFGRLRAVETASSPSLSDADAEAARLWYASGGLCPPPDRPDAAPTATP